MSQPGLRLLDRGLPRLTNVFTPEFKLRMDARQRGLQVVPPSPERVVATRTRSNYERQHRRKMAELAAAIHVQTRMLTVNPDDKNRSVAEIMEAVARQHSVSIRHIKGTSRALFLVAVRHQAIVRVYLAHWPRLSLPQIGKAMGGRDHTTVLHAVQKAGHWVGIAVTDAQILRECASYFEMKAAQTETMSSDATMKAYASFMRNLRRIADALDQRQGTPR